MGGSLTIRIEAGDRDVAEATAAAALVARRIDAWAARLTRFTEASELSRLNAVPCDTVAVRPTLGAVLRWGADAERRTTGIVDVALLDARLAAEFGPPPTPEAAPEHAAAQPGQRARWTVSQGARGAVVHRRVGLRFDLDGVAKGWIADRALALLDAWPAAVIDADGDIALACSPKTAWHVAIEDPFDPDATSLAALRMGAAGRWRERFGIATSGTTVHRWTLQSGRPRHHLIDPRTGSPAVTDLVQATVAAPSAAEAELLAKATVILGSHAGASLLERSNASFGFLVREDRTTVEVPVRDREAAA
jgi:thiamine biosynthesis lipoprotein